MTKIEKDFGVRRMPMRIAGKQIDAKGTKSATLGTTPWSEPSLPRTSRMRARPFVLLRFQNSGPIRAKSVRSSSNSEICRRLLGAGGCLPGAWSSTRST